MDFSAIVSNLLTFIHFYIYQICSKCFFKNLYYFDDIFGQFYIICWKFEIWMFWHISPSILAFSLVAFSNNFIDIRAFLYLSKMLQHILAFAANVYYLIDASYYFFTSFKVLIHFHIVYQHFCNILKCYHKFRIFHEISYIFTSIENLAWTLFDILQQTSFYRHFPNIFEHYLL